MKILITTVPFGQLDKKPIQLLKEIPDIELFINPTGRKLKESELPEFYKDADIVIAGLEKITCKLLDLSPKLKMISRVGIGLDNIDLKSTRERGIVVTYTPEAPAPAVAELTIGQMLNLMRSLVQIDKKIRTRQWERISGERLANLVIGLIGVGRIGSRVLKHLQGFEPKCILVNDINPNLELYKKYNAKQVDKEVIYKESDIISLHVPLTSLTKDLITFKEINLMKNNVSLINTSRGEIINESDLFSALKERRIKGAALDVFSFEPYTGPLLDLDNCIFSCHMGSMTSDCRTRMEIEAVEEAISFIKNEPLKNIVPDYEYDNCMN